MISITNLTANRIEEDFFKKINQMILGEEKQKGEISVVLVGSGIMRKLNKQYRKRNKVTDVLSFESTQWPEFVIPLGKEKELGEVVICLREVKKNAKKTNSEFREELATVFIHSLLHLLGYDHEKTDKQAKTMMEKQNYYLKKWQSLT